MVTNRTPNCGGHSISNMQSGDDDNNNVASVLFGQLIDNPNAMKWLQVDNLSCGPISCQQAISLHICTKSLHIVPVKKVACWMNENLLTKKTKEIHQE